MSKERTAEQISKQIGNGSKLLTNEITLHAQRFARWICENGYDSKQIFVRPIWAKLGTGRQYSTEELYQKYLHSLTSNQLSK